MTALRGHISITLGANVDSYCKNMTSSQITRDGPGMTNWKQIMGSEMYSSTLCGLLIMTGLLFSKKSIVKIINLLFFLCSLNLNVPDISFQHLSI